MCDVIYHVIKHHVDMAVSLREGRLGIADAMLLERQSALMTSSSGRVGSMADADAVTARARAAAGGGVAGAAGRAAAAGGGQQDLQPLVERAGRADRGNGDDGGSGTMSDDEADGDDDEWSDWEDAAGSGPAVAPFDGTEWPTVAEALAHVKQVHGLDLVGLIRQLGRVRSTTGRSTVTML